MSYVLIWLVAFMASSGPSIQSIKEPLTFADLAKCEKFAAEYNTRFADWMRGALGESWKFKISVTHYCQPGGLHAQAEPKKD